MRYEDPRYTPPNPDFDARVRDSFRRQPAMELVGGKINELVPGLCRIEIDGRREVKQQHGFIHGGIVGMAADTAAGYAAFSMMPADSTVLTAEYKINFLAPADGERIVATACVRKPGKTLMICDLSVSVFKDGVESECAMGIATMICMRGRADAPPPAKK